MLVARVVTIRLLYGLVGVKLVFARVAVISRKHFQGKILTIAKIGEFQHRMRCQILESGGAYWRLRASQTVEVEPNPSLPRI